MKTTNKSKKTVIKNIKIDSYLPIFSGFYDTGFDPYFQIENYFESSDSEINYSEYYDYYFDYEKYYSDVSVTLCEIIQQELKNIGFNVNIKFQNLHKPKYYNYSNDSINCKYTLSESEYKKIIKYLKDNLKSFQEYLEKNYTSRDGFISHYSNEADDWFYVLENKLKGNSQSLAHEFGSILNFILQNERYDESKMYEEFLEQIYVFNYFSNDVNKIDFIDYIIKYTKENYQDKSIETITNELYEHFENEYLEGILKKPISYETIEDYVNKTINDIESNTLEIEFKKGGKIKQAPPQYDRDNYGSLDRKRLAKPVGFRYKRIEDKKTSRLRRVTKDDREYYMTPSDKLIKAYKDKEDPMHEKARKMIYFENRADHSDKSLSGRSFGEGGDIKSYKIYLESWSADVYEDDYERGQLNHVNYFGENVNKTFDNPDQLFNYIINKILFSNKITKEDFYAWEDGEILVSQLVDEENFEASKYDIEEWKKGRKKLYNADYRFYISIIDKKIPTVNELSKILGISQYKKGGKIKQAPPQYERDNYGSLDRKRLAKPVGFRYKRIEDKKTGRLRRVTKDDREYYMTPSDKLIKAYKDKEDPMHEKARKMIYFENRADHSDKSLSGRTFERGGILENELKNKLSSNEKISVDLLASYLGRNPNYEEEILGYKLRKCYLQPYYKLIN